MKFTNTKPLILILVITLLTLMITASPAAAGYASLIVGFVLTLRGDLAFDVTVTAKDFVAPAPTDAVIYRHQPASRDARYYSNPFYLPPGTGPLPADTQHAINELCH